jgi:hypothetical protein
LTLEVGDCAGTGLAQCIFTFVDRTGNRLELATIGEGLEDRSGHASVNRTRLRCGKSRRP